MRRTGADRAQLDAVEASRYVLRAIQRRRFRCSGCWIYASEEDERKDEVDSIETTVSYRTHTSVRSLDWTYCVCSRKMRGSIKGAAENYTRIVREDLEDWPLSQNHIARDTALRSTRISDPYRQDRSVGSCFYRLLGLRAALLTLRF